MVIRGGLRGFAIALTLGVSLPALAADWGASDYAEVTDEQGSVTLSGGIGIISIEANEYVYLAAGSDTRTSQLIWQSTAPMLTAGLDVALPEGWTFAVNMQVAMGGDSYMEDYDWIAPFATGTGDDDWSDRSQHDDTDLDWYINGSILVGHDLVVSDNLTVNINGGFKYTDVQWAAYGGSYVYSDVALRDDVGEFADGEPGITYRQSFPALVAGLDAEWVEGGWTLGASAQAGFTFYGTGDDHHWMRVPPLNFIDSLESAPLVSVGASMGYEVAEGVNLFVAGTAEQIFTARGDTNTYNNNTGVLVGTDLDGAGGDLFAASITAGVQGTF